MTHRLIALITFLPWFAVPALAHRLPTAFTSIEFNENTGMTEIVHHLHAHDAHSILERLHKDQELLFDSVKGRAYIALYVQERFELSKPDADPPISLTLIGAELESNTLYVYQEYKGKLTLPLRVRNGILQDLFSNQTNTVNIKIGKKIHTLTFRKDEWQSLEAL